ncbi:MAG: hypothetical protein INR73_05955 [Williamsia sp.]|nr:hypothetical protein [Williamsia sp.]
MPICLIIYGKGVAQQHAEDEPFIIESYYKIKWGHADEFISLWKKNHLPLDKEAQKKGDIISITADKPRLHSGEDTRWDFKVTVVYKNSQAAFDHDLTAPYKKKLYPDLERLSKEEKERFELVIAHWDVMTERMKLE